MRTAPTIASVVFLLLLPHVLSRYADDGSKEEQEREEGRESAPGFTARIAPSLFMEERGENFNAYRAELKAEYARRTDGGVLSDERIDAAFANVTYEWNFNGDGGAGEGEDEDEDEDEIGIGIGIGIGVERRLQTTLNILVSLWSQGYPQNPPDTRDGGFYCIGIKNINWRTNLPRKRTKLVMLDCEGATQPHIGIDYVTSRGLNVVQFGIKGTDVWSTDPNGLDWGWVMDTNNRQNGRLFVDRFDIERFEQVWDIRSDRTIRPTVQVNETDPRCLTVVHKRNGPVRGKLKMAKCSFEGDAGKAQSWRLCALRTASCSWGADDRLTGNSCNIGTRCT